MSFSIVENVRSTHQDLDGLTDLLTKLLLPSQPKSHRDQLIRSHRIRYITDLISMRSLELLELYLDTDNSLSDEIRFISNTAYSADFELGGQNDPLEHFYDRLDQLHQFNLKYPQQQQQQPMQQILSSEQHFDWSGLEGEIIDGRDFIDRMFTGEEMLGRFLDLHLFHDRYHNLTSNQHQVHLKRLPYILFIDSFDQFDAIPRSTKYKSDYQTYLRDLSDYLKSFVKRTQPLHDLESDLENLKTKFLSDWSKGLVKSWQEEGEEQKTKDSIWCSACTKHYSKQTVYDAHLKSKKHLRASERAKESNGAADNQADANPQDKSSSTSASLDRSIAHLEAEIQHLSHHLGSIKLDTKSNVERRSALTDKERQQELLEFEATQRSELFHSKLAKAPNGTAEGGNPDHDNDDEDDENRIYNPLKLPLGWDGKPIPYWLYKLHGLGVEYKCEICSDFIYMGRKNFERHFQESRHAFGMRALGLPNTKHFHEITKIEDAFALAEKLKSEGRAEIFRDETMEELEDEEGNVYNRKTYEDLKRQGLL